MTDGDLSEIYESQRDEYLNLISTTKGRSELKRRVVNFLQFIWRRRLHPADPVGFDYFISTEKGLELTATLQVMFLDKDKEPLTDDWVVNTEKAKAQYLAYKHMRGANNRRITPIVVWVWGAVLFWCDLTEINIFKHEGKVPLQLRKRINVKEMYVPEDTAEDKKARLRLIEGRK